MSFTKQERRDVFNFLESTLMKFNYPVYYEHVRGYVSQAPPAVRKYIYQKCKGELLLEYFRRRKNYFVVDKFNVDLKGRHRIGKIAKKDTYPPENDEAGAEKKSKVCKRSFSDNTQESKNETMKQDCIFSEDNIERQNFEDNAIKYFTNYLMRNSKVELDCFVYEELPKKVKRLLSNYYEKKVRFFFKSFPGHFTINNEDYVVLVHQMTSHVDKNCTSKADNPPTTKTIVDKVDPEVQKGIDYIASLQFFISILRQKPLPFPIVKLSGYLSQAPKEVQSYLKFNYKTFSHFFLDAPLIFIVDTFGEVTLTDNSKKLFKYVKKFSTKALEKSLPPSEQNLKSRIDSLLRPQSKGVYDPPLMESVTIEGENETDTFAQEINSFGRDDIEDGCKDMNKFPSIQEQNWNEGKLSKTGIVLFQIPVDDKLLDFLFSVELYCVGIVEEEHWYQRKFSSKTINYFVDILERCRFSDFVSLQGYLGRAPREILSYMNKYYKNAKFKDFFLKYDQLFTLKSNLVTLASTYQNFFPTDNVDEEEICSAELLKTIYEMRDFRAIKAEILAYLYQVAGYLQNKGKTKMSRITEIRIRFPHCRELIQLSKGGTLMEKTGHFLLTFPIFEFPCKDFIVFKNPFSCGYLLMQYLKEASEAYHGLKDFTLSYYAFRKKMCILVEQPPIPRVETCNELSPESVKLINLVTREHLQIHSHLVYYELPLILPNHILKELTAYNRDSRDILLSLIDKDLILINGKIRVKQMINDTLPEKEDLHSDDPQSQISNLKGEDLSSADLILPEISKESQSSDACQSRQSLDFESIDVTTHEKDQIFKETELSKISVKNENTEPSDDYKASETDDLKVTGENKNINGGCNNSADIIPKPKVSRHKRIVENSCAEKDFIFEAADGLNLKNKHASELANILKDFNSKFINKPILSSTTTKAQQSNSCSSSDLLNLLTKDEDISKCSLHKEKCQSVDKVFESNVLSDVNAEEDSDLNQELGLKCNELIKTNLSGEVEQPSAPDPTSDKSTSSLKSSFNNLANENSSDNELQSRDNFSNEMLTLLAKDDEKCSLMQSEAEDNEHVLVTHQTSSKEHSIPVEENQLDTEFIQSVDYNMEDNQSKLKIAAIDLSCEGIVQEEKIFASNDQPGGQNNLLLQKDDMAKVENSDHFMKVETESTTPLNTCVSSSRNSLNTAGVTTGGDIVHVKESKVGKTVTSRKKFDSGFEEFECVYSDKIEAKLCEVSNSSSCSSFDDSSESASSPQADLCQTIEEQVSTTKHVKVRLSKVSPSPGYQNMAFETDTDSDTDSNDNNFEVADIMMFLKEAIKNPETCDHSEPYCISGWEFHADDPNFATLLSHEDSLPSDGDMKKEVKISDPTEDENSVYICPHLQAVETSDLQHLVTTENNSTQEECNKKKIGAGDPKIQPKKCVSKEPTLPSSESLSVPLEEENLIGDNFKLKSAEKLPPIPYPLQPLTAKIILLTTDSCIAQTKIESHLQNIYFLKSVYFCEEHDCCSDCFDLLVMGDEVSCFVPLSEIAHRTWIAFMVSKENPLVLDRMNSVNKVLKKQIKNNPCPVSEISIDGESQGLSNKSPSKRMSKRGFSSKQSISLISAESENQTPFHWLCQNCHNAENNEEWLKPAVSNTQVINYLEHSSAQSTYSSSEVGCQANAASCVKCDVLKCDISCLSVPNLIENSVQTSQCCTEVECQTFISGPVKRSYDTAEVMCQTPLKDVHHAYVQAGRKMTARSCQTSTPGVQKIPKSCQTDVTENSDIICQTDFSGDVKTVFKSSENASQTISTGAIMVTNYYHY